jgi:hypothetical protein
MELCTYVMLYVEQERLVHVNIVLRVNGMLCAMQFGVDLRKV